LEFNKKARGKMKNVKIKVETDEQNLKIQERVHDLNKEDSGFAWGVFLNSGNDYYDYYDYQDYDRAVCFSWKKYKYLVIDNDLDLIICTNEDIWKQREEKEVSFEEFMVNNE